MNFASLRLPAPRAVRAPTAALFCCLTRFDAWLALLAALFLLAAIALPAHAGPVGPA